MSTAWGVGIATIDATGATLDARFRALGVGDTPTQLPTYSPGVDSDPSRGVALRAINISIDTSVAPTSAEDVYLRLHLLSHRLALPRTLNLDGAFGLLQNAQVSSRQGG